MMYKCIMVKIGGSNKRKSSKKRKIEIWGKFINFAEIGRIYKCCGNRGIYAISIIGLGALSR